MDHSGSRWYWTIASFGLCHCCGANVDRAFIAYNFATRTVYRVACAEETGVATECRESKRARSARHRRLIAEAESVPTVAGTP